jgi:hypothetical protein
MTANEDVRLALCDANAGEHYESQRWCDAADALDWSGLWPIVNATGCLTGELTDCDDDDDYANVDDMAMVLISDLPIEEQRRIHRDQRAGYWDGYTRLPERRARN